MGERIGMKGMEHHLSFPIEMPFDRIREDEKRQLHLPVKATGNMNCVIHHAGYCHVSLPSQPRAAPEANSAGWIRMIERRSHVPAIEMKLHGDHPYWKFLARFPPGRLPS